MTANCGAAAVYEPLLWRSGFSLAGRVEGGSLSTDFFNHNIDLFVLLRNGGR